MVSRFVRFDVDDFRGDIHARATIVVALGGGETRLSARQVR